MPDHSVAETIVNEVEYLQRLQCAGVPQHLHEGLVRYLVHHIKPGAFLTAVLENRLDAAIVRGDEDSVRGLRALVTFLHHDGPPAASGTPTLVRMWLERRERLS